MRKYEVTLYYHTSATVIVEAEDEADAIETAYNVVSNKELLQNLQEDNDPDVEEVEG